MKLTLLHTNDLHGRLHQLSRISTLVKKIRSDLASQNGHCYYFDAGDSEDTTLLECCLTRGSTMDALLKGAGCNQIALGNAIPIRYGPQAVENLSKHFGKPILCANLQDRDGRIFPGLAPYVIENCAGVSIGIIGLTAPMKGYSTIFKVNALQPVEVVAGLIEQIRGEGAQTIIVLSHIGSKADIELAEQVAGIDIIIGGHDHERISPPLSVNGTLIVQSGEHGEMLGRLDLELDPLSGKVVNYQGELIPVDETVVEDNEILEMSEAEKERAHALMQVAVGELLEPVEYIEDQECAAGNLMADALLAHVEGAQIAFTLNGHWNNGLKAGIVTKEDIYSANRSAGNPARCELTGTQLIQFFKAAYKPENVTRKIHPLRGRMVGYPHVAGLIVEVNKNDLEDVSIYFEKRKVQVDDRLIAAGSDLEFSEILGYLPIPDELIEYEVPTVLPELLEEYIAKRSPLAGVTNNRIRFI